MLSSLTSPHVSDLSSFTLAHKNAVRLIRKIKYFVARRKFQQVGVLMEDSWRTGMMINTCRPENPTT